ncbi:MAG: amidase [Pseudomonadales bacterium]|nr:amidase [Pseudomonadales bacterium]
MNDSQSVNPEEATITELRRQLDRGEMTPEALVRSYLQRIDQLDPHLNSFITINRHAIEDARKLDQKLSGEPAGALHGIPVVLKDNIDTADGMPNTAGSLLLQDNFPAADAGLVQRLRQAGAIILGKTNLSEWANFRSTHSSSGWSAVGGQVNNPYDLSRNPCGSSAGTAVAVAANLAVAGVGTETNGSVICPAALNNLVGIKPTLGLISQHGIIPIAHSQDTAGPMARTVRDATILLEVMSGRDDFQTALVTDGLQGERLAIATNMMGYHPGLDAHFNQQLAVLTTAGASVTRCEVPNHKKWGKASYEVLLYEFRHDISSYLATTKSSYRTLTDLIHGNESLADRELAHFGQEIFIRADQKGPLTEEAYLHARAEAKRLAGPDGIDAALAACEADILIAPTTSPAWKTDLVMGDNFAGSASGAAAIAGYPHITVPMGFIAGLPVGLSFFASAGQEKLLLEAAFAYEQLTHHRRPPPAFP